MNNIFQIKPERFEKELDDIDLHFIGNYSAEFLEIPSMVDVFWDIIHGRAEANWKDNEDLPIIPFQDEFKQKYMDQHWDDFKSLSDSKQEGVKARVLKTYPSLIREYHFITQVQQIVAQSDITSTLLISNSTVDLGMGVDLGIQINGVSFALRITKTDSTVDWEEIKEDRKSNVTVPHPITVVAKDSTTYSVGAEDGNKLFLFKREVVENTLEKCQEVAQSA